MNSAHNNENNLGSSDIKLMEQGVSRLALEATGGADIYWSMPLTEHPNLSLFIPAMQLAKSLDTGSKVTIIMNDLHSQLLNAIDQKRTDFHRSIVETMMKRLSKSTENLNLILASDICSQKNFMLDFYMVAGSTPINTATEAVEGVVKPKKHPLLGGLVYPVVRAVEDKYMQARTQLAPENERNILKFTDELALKINHLPGSREFYSELPGLSAKKLTVINPEDDQVSLLDNPKQIKKKISKAFCEPGNIIDNGVLPILEHIIFPIFKVFDIKRPEQYGGDVQYSSYKEVETDYSEQKLHPGDLKKGIESKITDLLECFHLLRDEKIVAKRNAKTSLKASISIDEPLNQVNNEKLELITGRLQEVLQQDSLKAILHTRNPRIYWGTATTGRPHVAYFVPIAKIADFLRADCELTILLADLHGYLDSQKAPWELLDARTKYYQHIIISMLKSIGVPIEKLKFARGTEFELSANFSRDLFRLISQTTLHDAKRAGAEVVKQMSDPLIGSLLYPLLQALDEEYLSCDAQFGGVDQRKIFIYAEKYLPQIGYSKRIHLMNPMVPGLSGGKMSSSEIDSKIDLLDDAETVKTKLDGALCSKENLSENGVLAFIEHVIWPLFGKITIESQSKEFESHEKLVQEFVAGSITEIELKTTTASYINRLLDPIRKEFQSEELQTLVRNAYPKI
uniref:Tyrosine--tRNA ligase n=1 Tax=Aceria tosichella TaxID=561515 RepID=A0A6G1SKN4_9ACAR